jgi:hypothetical protein
MSVALIAGLSLPGIYLLALVGTPVVLWWEKRHPSSYSRRPEVVESWREMSTAEQEAHDNAVLDAAEAAENVAARVSSLYRS